jgi:uncharacterized membrane protein YczE
MYKQRIIIFLLVLCLSTAMMVPTVSAGIEIGDVLKVYGIGLLVDRFSEPLNKFINGLTGNHNVASVASTKVVPIVSIGAGTYIGAAQVTGPEELVDQVKAVAQIEGNFHGRTFRIKALIPLNSKNPIGASRIEGVGVSAVIDVKP